METAQQKFFLKEMLQEILNEAIEGKTKTDLEQPRESPEFHDLLLRDKNSWPRCLLWHGWLPALACTGGASPWAALVDDVACARLERLFGSYSEEGYGEWVPSVHFVDSVASSDVSDHPGVWTDGSFVLDELSGIGVGGCGVYSLRSGAGWFDRRLGHLELLPLSEPGVALQCSSTVHLEGVDNLNVVRHVSRILDGRVACGAFELPFDGDLLTVIERIIMRMTIWLLLERFGLKIGLVMILLTELLIVGDAESLT